MDFSDLKKRVANLEKRQALRNFAALNLKDHSSAEWLDMIAEATWRLKDRAEHEGDYRTALACLDSLSKSVPLRAELRRELHEANSADVLDPDLDGDRCVETAETFLQRKKAKQGGTE
jgi:hypothetical protein